MTKTNIQHFFIKLKEDQADNFRKAIEKIDKFDYHEISMYGSICFKFDSSKDNIELIKGLLTKGFLK